jgi:hypothetical protein
MHARSVLSWLLAGVVLAGCGGGGVAELAAPAAPVVSAAPAAAAPPGPAAGAAQAAAAINLVAADLPDFVQGPAPELTPALELAEERAQACVQGPPVALRVARVPSSTFTRPASGDTVGSEVYVMKDAATAQKELATLDHPEIDTCLGSFVAEALALTSGGTVTASRTSTTGLAVDASHGVAVVGRRVEAQVNGAGAQLRLYMDVVALQHRSTVTTVVLSRAGEPSSRDERNRLVGLLTQRMATSAV